jgi:ATP phosphoribosyltransferase regulatory subunit HisZ
MSDAHMRATLGRIFAALLKEVARNERLAGELVRAIGDASLSDAPRPVRRAAFDPSQHGEAALRGRLDEIRSIANLRSVALASGLVLSGRALKGRSSRGELIGAIVAAAKHYDSQRSAASA